MTTLLQPLRAFLRLSRRARQTGRSGQTLVEYALIICMMSILAIAIYTLLNGQIERIFSVIANNLDTSQGSH